MVYSIIQKSQLEGAHRLDAEFYQPEYLDLEEKFGSLKTKTIEEVSKSVVSFGAYSLTSYIEWQDSGVPYINVSDIHDGYIDFSNVKYISEKVDEILKKSRVTNDQVLLTMAGTIGNAAVAYDLPKKVNANQAIAKITLLDNISPYYLAAFLNSKYGLLQTQREIVSSVQANIFLGPIKKFKIPIFDRKITEEIERKYKSFLSELENSKSLYSQAEDLLLEKLGLSDFRADEDLYSIVNLSDVITVGRMDAEYFQPKYEKLIEIAKEKFDILELEKIFNFRRGDFISTNYYTEQKTPMPYIRIKELSKRGGIDESKIIFISESYSENNIDKLEENDLVIAIIGDTIGKTNRINKRLAGGFCSNNTGRLRIREEWSDKIQPEFSEILFQSTFVQSQIERKKAQTGQPKISDNEIKSIKIPILPKPTQQKIADLFRQSHEARREAKRLLEEAKQKVEELIEGKAKGSTVKIL